MGQWPLFIKPSINQSLSLLKIKVSIFFPLEFEEFCTTGGCWKKATNSPSRTAFVSLLTWHSCDWHDETLSMPLSPAPAKLTQVWPHRCKWHKLLVRSQTHRGGVGRGGKEATHHQSDTKLGDSHDLMMRAFCTLGPTVLSNSTASCRSWANSSGLSVYSGFKEATSLSTVARRGGTCDHHIDHNLFNPPLVHSHLQGGTCNCHIDHNLFNPQLVHCPLERWYLQQSFQVTTWLNPSLQEVTSGHHWQQPSC